LSAIILSASAGLRVLLDTMDEIYHHPRETGLRRFLVSVVLSLLFLLAIYLSIAVILTGDWFLHLIERILPREILNQMDFSSFSYVWQWLRYLLLLCFLILVVTALYRIGLPKGKTPRKRLLPCALLVALALVGVSSLFSRFIALSSRYSLVYGSLASLIILLIWLYLCGNILLLGVLLYRNWNRKRVDRGAQR